MPQSLPDTTTPKRRFRWPTGMPQLVALLLVLLVDHSQFKVINGDNVHQQYVVDAKGVWR